MSTLLSVAPAGFNEAISFISQLPVVAFEVLTADVLDFVMYKSSTLSLDRIYKAFPIDSPSIAEKDLQNVVNAVTYLYRAFVRDKLALDAVGAILQELPIGADYLTVLAKTWKSKSGGVTENLQRLLKVGTLVDVEWKVGVALQSSNCQSLNSPYVSMVIKVADSNGVIEAHPFELNLAEFQSFARQIQAIEDTLSGY